MVILGALGRFVRRKPLGAIGAAIVLAMLLMTVFAERIAPTGSTRRSGVPA